MQSKLLEQISIALDIMQENAVKHGEGFALSYITVSKGKDGTPIHKFNMITTEMNSCDLALYQLLCTKHITNLIDNQV
ncbi:MAG TPA: hypothetical protein PLP73_04215 [Candidatus Absconditabacterales bacterium]|nr:hypothetical protein [Candidatus Absconditabacterales bacterium]